MQTSAPRTFSIQELRDAVCGRVIAPGDPAYDEARTVMVGDIDRRPYRVVAAVGFQDAYLGGQSSAVGRSPTRADSIENSKSRYVSSTSKGQSAATADRAPSSSTRLARPRSANSLGAAGSWWEWSA